MIAVKEGVDFSFSCEGEGGNPAPEIYAYMGRQIIDNNN